MEFTDVIRRRRMIRRYDATEDLSRDQLTRFLELAIRAPSAGFSQGWDFVVLTRPVDRERFWTATTDPQVPADRNLVGVVSLGRPGADRPSPSVRRGRRPLSDVAHNGRFGAAWPGWRSGATGQK